MGINGRWSQQSAPSKRNIGLKKLNTLTKKGFTAIFLVAFSAAFQYRQSLR
jgi:hypothetical protein